MPGARDALCHQALQLLAELCARGALEHDSCQDFIYHLRDRSRPRLRDPGECRRLARLHIPGLGLGAAPGPKAGGERRGLGEDGKGSRGCVCLGGGRSEVAATELKRNPEPARRGLMLEPGGDPGEGCCGRLSPSGGLGPG